MKSLKKDKEQKSRLLDMLDNVEQNLRTIEKQEMKRGDRNRFAEQVESGLKEVENILKSKGEERAPERAKESSLDRSEERNYE